MAQVNAQLNGVITNDGGLACEGRFAFGIGALTDHTDWKAIVQDIPYYEIINNLDPNVEYWFRAEARNAVGVSTGTTLTFMTPVLPAVVQGYATNVFCTTATLNGTLVEDGGEACRVRFQYGTTVDYGISTDWQYPFVSLDTFLENLSRLGSNTIIHFRVQGQNSWGIASSPDMILSTLNADEHPCIGMDPMLIPLLA